MNTIRLQLHSKMPMTCAILTIALASFVILACSTGLPFQATEIHEPLLNSVSSAFGLLIAASALLLRVLPHDSPHPSQFSKHLASCCIFLGAVAFLYCIGTGNCSVEHFMDPLSSRLMSSQDLIRTSICSAWNLSLAGLSLRWLDWETTSGRRPFQSLALLMLIFPSQVLINNLFRIPLAATENASFHFPVLSLLGAAAWILLSSGILLSQPDRSLTRILTSATLVGSMVRQLLVAVLLFSAGLGLFIAERSLLSPTQQQWWTSLLVVGSLFIFIVLLAKRGTELEELHIQRDEMVELLKLATRNAEEANRTKSTFLANMSHEIRSPVNVMIGFSDLMAHPDCLPKERLNHAEVMRRNGQSLMTIIDDILDISKVEAGTLSVRDSEMNLRNLVDEVVLIHKEQAQKKGLQFELRIQEPLPEMIFSDPGRLRQILTNLLSNALKFTSQGSVSLQVRARQDHPDVDSTEIEFKVSDTGIGIHSHHASKLFQPFVQADSSVTREHGGSGLGLALSMRLAEALGGKLMLLHSQPGEGSTFQFILDVKLASSAASASVAAIAPVASVPTCSPKRNLKDLRVLLVDDALDNRTLMRWLLEYEGAWVETAENGKRAIELALAGNHDVVLMDIQMPEMDGLTASKKLRELGYEKPILALTAHAMIEDRDRSILAGLNDHISKPVQKNVLIEKLRPYLPQASTMRAHA